MSKLWRHLPLLALALAACDDGTPTCAEGFEVCDGACAPVLHDVTNCGACGNVCAAGFQCVEGACACADGELCDGRCVRLDTDADHCGACGNACDEGLFCVSGACCVAGEPDCTCEGAVCDGACVDVETDERNCGGCGIACGDGQSCLSGTCAVGDLYAACFNSGSVVPFLKESHAKTAPLADGIDGPQSLALLGDSHVVAVGGLDQTLHVIDRATMETVGGVLVGSAPNHVIVRDEVAYVVNSAVNTVLAVSLADPAAPAAGDEIPLGEGTNPMAAAFDDGGTLWVTLWKSHEVRPVNVEEGAAGPAIALPTEGLEGSPYPTGVAAIGDTIYVTLNNLVADGAYLSPAGNGRLVTIDRETKATALIDLGESGEGAPKCLNPGMMAVDGTKLVIACTGSYANDGEIVVYDTEAGAVSARHATGGAPARVALDPSRPGTIYAADSFSTNLFVIAPDGGVTTLEACPAPGEGGWEMAADVLVVP